MESRSSEGALQPHVLSCLEELQEELHGLAKRKGWYDDPETEAQFVNRACANLHDEVSEFHEAFREDRLWKPCDKAEKMESPLNCAEEELADLVIRAFDMAGKLQVNLANAIRVKHLYNSSRPYRHGGKLA